MRKPFDRTLGGGAYLMKEEIRSRKNGGYTGGASLGLQLQPIR